MKNIENQHLLPDIGPLLAVDYGESRIGLAICDGLQLSANPLTMIDCRGIDWTRIRIKFTEIVKDRIIVGLLFGLPFSLDGSQGKMAVRVTEFARFLYKQLNLPYHFIDERYSSFSAAEWLQERKISPSKRKGKIDSIAAAILLESYINSKTSQKNI